MKIKTISKVINNKKIPIILYNELPNKYILEKKNNYIKIKSKKLIKENKEINEKFRYYFNNFVDILSDIENCNFDNFNTNIKSLKIEEKYSKIKGFLKYASYFTKDNKVQLYNQQFYNNLNHELLHMASNKKVNDDLVLTGFSIIDFKN